MLPRPERDESARAAVIGRERFISDAQVEKALAFLRDSASQLGEAKSRAVKAEHMVKHIEALLAKASEEKSAEARKADARCSDQYVEAINEDAFAAGELSKLYALREAASMLIEAWRSSQANFRAMKL